MNWLKFIHLSLIFRYCVKVDVLFDRKLTGIIFLQHYKSLWFSFRDMLNKIENFWISFILLWRYIVIFIKCKINAVFVKKHLITQFPKLSTMDWLLQLLLKNTNFIPVFILIVLFFNLYFDLNTSSNSQCSYIRALIIEICLCSICCYWCLTAYNCSLAFLQRCQINNSGLYL